MSVADAIEKRGPMAAQELHVVTGAFGFSGRSIARRLLAAGRRVRTLTGSPGRENPFGDRVEVRPFHFDDPSRLTESLRGAAALYNTYWIRFPRAGMTFDLALRHTRTLFAAASEAGVRRIVHVSITNPSEDSPFDYFRGKALAERALKESGPSWAILRPAVLFGPEGILINNIAWALRSLPVFAIFGDGRYRLRPIHVDDLAALAVEEGTRTENRTVDAVGPETFAYRDLVRLISEAIGKPRRTLSVPVSVGWRAAWLIGMVCGDVMLTRQEVEALVAGLLDSDAPTTGPMRLSDWVRANADSLGRRYFSELARRLDRREAYPQV